MKLVKKIIVTVCALGLSTMIQAETYSLVMQSPNGYKIPKVIGASGGLAPLTGYDYFDWFGITHHRTWFRPSISSLPNDSSVTSASAFAVASEAIRQDPLRQATSSDYYIDWNDFNSQFNLDIADDMQRLVDLGIESMICNTVFIDNGNRSIAGDWGNTFKYWKHWYSMVYYMASNYGVTMYEFKNEPSGRSNYDYDIWESHWLVAADAMRKAMADVNEDYGRNLSIYICGPTAQGPYWDYSLPDTDTHALGNVSWTKVKYDIYGNYDVNNPWNYGMYDYHRYASSGSAFGGEIQQARINIANAQNDPRPDIPIVITEMNTSTAAGFRGLQKDPEDPFYGVSIAQLLQSTAGLGPSGLGDEGGLFAFKLGAAVTWEPPPYSGVWNHFCYVSRNAPYNYGGITRGGASLQMYTRHFSGGKAVVPFNVTSGDHDQRRTIAAIDEELGAYRIYGSNVTGVDDTVTIDLSALNVLAGMPVTIQRVDAHNIGQITEFVTLDSAKSVSFSTPNFTTFLVTVPKGNAVNGVAAELRPSDDTYQSVTSSAAHGADTTLKVSLHHTDAAKRRAALLRFQVSAEERAHRVLLKVSGKNSGVDPTEREILHVYAVTNQTNWSEASSMTWTSLPGLGKYHINESTMGSADGTGDMVDIEDNYAGYTDGAGKGLGIYGSFLGAISFHSSSYETAGLDVTDYLNSLGGGTSSVDVTFVIVRTVRYNVNEYDNPYYYNKGVYHYDDRVVELASDEHTDPTLRPRLVCWGNDAVAPEPDLLVWSSAPQAASAYVIEMTAVTVYDPSGVEYYFTETSGNPGGDDSGWQSSPFYVDTGLSPNLQYAYTLTVRDPIGNTSSPSEPALVSTPLDADTDAPTPNPMGWASVPAVDTATSISMTAATASDTSGGVEYYFEETSGNPGGSDSGWQSSPSYTDTGLSPSVQYAYTVTARDVSLSKNATVASRVGYATTPGSILFSDDFSDGNRDGWYMTQANGNRDLDASRGYLETVSDTYSIWGGVANFPAADLSVVGAKVKLTLDFQVLEDLGSRVITMGLFDSKGTRLAADEAQYGNGIDDSGYWLYNGGDTNTPHYWLKSGYATGLGNVNGTTSMVKKDPSAFTTVDATWHTFSLELEKTAGGMLVTQITDEGLASEWKVSATDTTGNITSIDQVAIQAITQDYAIDNVVVEYDNPDIVTGPITTLALTVFSDDFSDNNRDGWYQTYTNGVRALDTSNGYMETVSDTYAIWGAAANFPAADLSVVGNSVKLTLDFQILEGLGSRTISMGLYDSNGTQLSTDVADAGVAVDDSGYWLYNGGDATTPRYWLKSGYATGLGNVNGTTSLIKKDPSPFTTVDATWHTFSLELEKTAGGMLITQITDEGLASEWKVSATDTTGNITSIDQVAIQAITQDYAIDNVVVTYYYSSGNTTSPYYAWVAAQGLTAGVNNALGDDPEADGMDNLLEYALGGNPLLNDAAAFLPKSEVMTDGSNHYLNYIYRRRIDYADRGLSYSVGSAPSLAEALTNATEEVGSVAIDAAFESVTNRVSMDAADSQFMQLRVTIE